MTYTVGYHQPESKTRRKIGRGRVVLVTVADSEGRSRAILGRSTGVKTRSLGGWQMGVTTTDGVTADYSLDHVRRPPVWSYVTRLAYGPAFDAIALYCKYGPKG